MIIKTEYDIGDTFFMIYNEEIIDRTVTEIKAVITNNTKNINYQSITKTGKNCLITLSNRMYNTKQEAGIAWLKKQGLSPDKLIKETHE